MNHQQCPLQCPELAPQPVSQSRRVAEVLGIPKASSSSVQFNSVQFSWFYEPVRVARCQPSLGDDLTMICDNQLGWHITVIQVTRQAPGWKHKLQKLYIWSGNCVVVIYQKIKLNQVMFNLVKNYIDPYRLLCEPTYQ